MASAPGSFRTNRCRPSRQFTMGMAAVVLLTANVSTGADIDPLKRQEMDRLLSSGAVDEGEVLKEIAQFVLLPLLLGAGFMLVIRRAMLP